MIWKFDFSRRTLLWLLGLSFLAGTGLEIKERWTGRRSVERAGVVSFSHDPELLAIADSLYSARAEELARPIDVNTAEANDLERLPGIGPVLALRIVSHREQNGPFRSVDELENVSGIGPKKLEALRDRVTLSQP
ncbi:MAG: helix-hairpin-helix domain-containing protein [Calditrichaeota bacterium]|nr:helix-hairpin-helix domain-containing protein [Calditrichota bacterium]MCB9391476.1 helix-hairpin-helix domain-containing protein [Calditrichota bacterium]